MQGAGSGGGVGVEWVGWAWGGRSGRGVGGVGVKWVWAGWISIFKVNLGWQRPHPNHALAPPYRTYRKGGLKRDLANNSKSFAN